VAAASTGPTWWLLGRPASYLLLVAGLYAALAATILRRLPTDHPGPGVGAANRVTLLRAALALPVMALAIAAPPSAGALPVAAVWWVIVVSTLAMLLDGLDGRIARSTGTTTDFGARFDMELDAALIMALSVLVWTSGRAGAWVLLVGLMRYLFVAAGFVVPALNGTLPESFRRKVVCVVQGVVLLVALGPVVPRTMAATVAAAGLVALTWSFAVDVAWLLRAAGQTEAPESR
jgi:phosphatidylglycerophosphate synthase